MGMSKLAHSKNRTWFTNCLYIKRVKMNTVSVSEPDLSGFWTLGKSQLFRRNKLRQLGSPYRFVVINSNSNSNLGDDYDMNPIPRR